MTADSRLEMNDMTKYEVLQEEAYREGLIVKEKPLQAHDGRIKDNRVAIRQDIPTSSKKACVLAEELGHHYTSTGNILDQSDVSNRKQELRARRWAHDQMIGLQGIIDAYEAGCRSRSEAAEFLGVTEEFLQEAVECYRDKYGTAKQIGRYVVYFVPELGVMRGM